MSLRVVETMDGYWLVYGVETLDGVTVENLLGCVRAMASGNYMAYGLGRSPDGGGPFFFTPRISDQLVNAEADRLEAAAALLLGQPAAR